MTENYNSQPEDKHLLSKRAKESKERRKKVIELIDKKLKVYHGCIDGKNDFMAAVHSKAEFANLARTSTYAVDLYAGRTTSTELIAVAMSKPHKLFKRSAYYYQDGDTWKVED